MTSSWFFLSTLNYDARSTTHQIYWKCLLHHQSMDVWVSWERLQFLPIFHCIEIAWCIKAAAKARNEFSRSSNNQTAMLQCWEECLWMLTFFVWQNLKTRDITQICDANTACRPAVKTIQSFHSCISQILVKMRVTYSNFLISREGSCGMLTPRLVLRLYRL